MKDTTQLLLEKAERAIRAAEVLRDADEAEFASRGMEARAEPSDSTCCT